MTNIYRFLQVFALGTWLGAIVFLSFVVAPGAFASLAGRDQAGTFVGLMLSRLHVIGMIAGMVFLVVAVLAGSFAALWKPAPLLVIAMLLLTIASQGWVRPRIAELRRDMGSIETTPADDPRHVAFDQLHKVSVSLEGAVLLIGIAALYFTIREKPF
ncbi:MAG TPA: DUF4149 domain-containing protein [Candidatus Acidoferrales bacterium]|jgi:hypothetical protein|nr:DUF4149 domain-containing protein [Candidatus Acidoferrales bacterium]